MFSKDLDILIFLCSILFMYHIYFLITVYSNKKIKMLSSELNYLQRAKMLY